MPGKVLPVLHFNECVAPETNNSVYRVRQKIRNSTDYVGADQFAQKIDSIRQGWHEKNQVCQREAPQEASDWRERQARDRKGLVLFSGDLFNPSLESSVTRGAHMVPVVNAMQVDAACLGNHDWDFGYPHLQTLMSKCNFPWLFSNVVDASWREQGATVSDKIDKRDKQIEYTLPYFTMQVDGIKVGCIGLVEQEWLDTVPGFPEHFEYRDMVEVGKKYSKELREGPEQCDLIIAITHCRLFNDVKLANALGAVRDTDVQEHGVDLVLGGHDHVYYIGNGVEKYEGDAYDNSMGGTEDDKSTYLIKSGTDFHDLSELALTLSEPHAGTVRRRTIDAIAASRHVTHADDPVLPEVKKLIDDLMSRVDQSVGQSVAYSLTEWDSRANMVRLDESALGDFISDILLTSADHALRSNNAHNTCELLSENDRFADCCIICGGSLRGDAVFGPGEITLGNIMEVMPFEDPIVVKDLSGQDIWDALENGFSMYPRQEGRFPQISGLHVVWDSSREPGKRVVSVDILQQPFDGVKERSARKIRKQIREHFSYATDDDNSVTVLRAMNKVKEPLARDKMYRVVTREYLALGNDGFHALARGRYIIDDETGQLMATIVRKFLLGASYIWRWKQLRNREHMSGANSELDGTFTPETMSPDTSLDGASTAHHAPSLREEAVVRRAQQNGHRSAQTDAAIQRACDVGLSREEQEALPKRRKSQIPLVVDHSPIAIRDAFFVAANEHHSQFDRASRTYMSKDPQRRKGTQVSVDANVVAEDAKKGQDDLAVVLVLTDGRMVDRAREADKENGG
ncbi:hypothetical protein MVES1_003744 [Malassezia vespertilionis]|uniref:5'-Nucleotidase C-terminal domain-containing protein n=1 Tax=Malassezia vespertilionis TaxID=2020962 RepID=A0A2N1J8F3_9BASI|nr:uncharacterized protein MVES1_003744 [Malassezia vespertilionis]PKI82840.1 hypothetical protein MVES_003302 [Malassezia vespertilionis]WFD08372.1 hypothetical protein MVES1_003744 [Malassezia vespertilionis]